MITTSSTATFTRGGVISTVSGGLSEAVCSNLSCGGFSGDGGSASGAQLLSPGSVAVDAAGDLYIADTLNQRIRKVSTSGIITTVAGSGTTLCGNGVLNGAGQELCGGFSGDGGPATAAKLSNPGGVAVDAAGNLYIADTGNNRIRKVSPAGIITTVVGTGTAGFNTDYAPGTSMELYQPHGVAVDTSGNLFIADTYNNRIRMMLPDGIVTTVAGSGPAPCVTSPSAGLCGGLSGDGGPATSASLYWPQGIGLDTSGNLFIADFENGRVRMVSPSGVITTVAGGGPDPCGFYDSGCIPPSGDGGPATSAVVGPIGVVVDVAGNLFIADAGYSVIRTVSAGSGIISTVAGRSGHAGSVGGNGPAPATSADLYGPEGIALDAYGNLFIADSSNNRVREVSLVAAPAKTPSFNSGERVGVQFKAFASPALPLRVAISFH
jgi:sugar lactone lactonase YvrE